jgi:cobaltochelatase CobT
LGFTTRNWKGGNARIDWKKAGKPLNPGRLCELMHIVYKSHDEDIANLNWSLALLTYEKILRENIDGEALLWVKYRADLTKFKKLKLIVISDGAPVDDSTLSVNPENFLVDHTKQVIAEFQKSKSIQIGGIGINHPVDQYYEKSVFVEDLNRVLPKLVDLLEEIVNGSAK